jgi:hypothetical protein
MRPVTALGTLFRSSPNSFLHLGCQRSGVPGEPPGHRLTFMRRDSATLRDGRGDGRRATTFHTPLPGHGSSGARRPSGHRGVEPRAGLMVKALNGDWLPLLLDEVKLHGDPLSWRGDVDNIPVL